MSQPCTASRLAAWRALLETNQMLTDVLDRRLHEEQALPLSWHEVLALLSRSPDGALRMSDLAGRLALSRSGLTRLVDRMQAAGLLERRSCGWDRRGAYAVLTEKGGATAHKATPLFLVILQEHFGRHLTEQEAEILTNLLARIRGAHTVAPIQLNPHR